MKFLKRQSVFLLVGLFLVAGALVSGVVHAQAVGSGPSLDDETISIQTEIIIPGSEPIFDNGLLRGKVGDLAGYLNIIYNFLISIVGVVAGVFILIGGFQYLTAGGDAARVTGAKKRIGNALIGFILALSSYLLLNTINPDLVNLKLPEGLKQGVRTEAFFTPICEELVEQGFEVHFVLREFWTPEKFPNFRQPQCGDIGEITSEKGDRFYCMYRGSNCTPEPVKELGIKERTTCFPKNIEDYNPKEIVDRARKIFNDAVAEGKDPTRYVPTPDIGQCISCSNLTYYLGNLYKEELGYDSEQNGEAMCNIWSKIANGGAFDTGARERTGGVVSYCNWDLTANACMQTDIKCSSLDSCDDYDEVKTPYYQEKDRIGAYSHGGTNRTQLEERPDHLTPVCKANPCGINLSEGQGCRPGDLGVIDAITIVAYDVYGSNDCVSK